MMRKTLQSLALAAFLLVGMNANVDAQTLKVPTPSTLQKVTQGFGLSEVSLEYSRPSVKGRTIFGDLVSYGKIWRTGANAASKITFGEDVNIAGQDLKAGTYAIYTIPGEKEWQVMFYSDLKLGGNVADYDAQYEAAKITVPVKATGGLVETFYMGFSNITDTSMDLDLKWENTKITLPISVNIDDKVMASIDAALKDNRPYFQAAMYYFNNGKDINKALEWINLAAANNPNAFWVLLNKAKIQHKLGQHAEAIKTAEDAKAKASAAKNDDYVKMSTELIGTCTEELKNAVKKK